MNLLIIGLILFLIWWFFFKENTKSLAPPLKQREDNTNMSDIVKEQQQAYNLAPSIYPFYDEIKSNWYREITIPFLWKRKTFVYGELTGKYYGEHLPNPNDQAIYQITIYEGIIHPIESQNCTCITTDKTYCSGIHKHQEGGFTALGQSVFFDKSQLPQKFQLHFPNDQLIYTIALENIVLHNIFFPKNLHQKDNKEVFGTIKCIIKGNFFDMIANTRTLREYKPLTNDINQPSFPNIFTLPKSTSSDTSSTTTKNRSNTNNLSKVGYKSKRHKKAFWNNHYKNSKNNKGCIGLNWFPTLLILFFLVVLFPSLKFVISLLIIIIVLSLIPSKMWEWLIKIGVVLYFTLIVVLIGSHIFNRIPQNIVPLIEIPKYVVASPTIKPAPTTEWEELVHNSKQDTLLKFSKEWKDYTGTNYKGNYHIYKSDYNISRNYKNQLFTTNQKNDYNYIVHKLKDFDQYKLEGLYQMFDSIAHQRSLNNLQFASMVISFVQDYNYSLILPKECDADLYTDRFVKDYLTKNGGLCVPNEAFGLMTPVETIVTSNADCDTRTLLIYTILSKYDYDLIMLSSDLYGHSIIGINLPYYGRDYYKFGNTKYALVETTVSAARPGYIPNEIANMNNWYISLKSK